MGQRVQVGPITYVALETQWKTQLKEGVGSAVPNNRFLMIRMSLTNSGGANQAVPLMVLVDGKGAFDELPNVLMPGNSLAC